MIATHTLFKCNVMSSCFPVMIQYSLFIQWTSLHWRIKQGWNTRRCTRQIFHLKLKRFEVFHQIIFLLLMLHSSGWLIGCLKKSKRMRIGVVEMILNLMETMTNNDDKSTEFRLWSLRTGKKIDDNCTVQLEDAKCTLHILRKSAFELKQCCRVIWISAESIEHLLVDMTLLLLLCFARFFCMGR